ncbi:MAG TPA: site-2 protease family protein [Rhabdochlamydiaceae bacterium]|nr:site-2 protease family protein [Rhabdochlamydiaceae bacterium]
MIYSIIYVILAAFGLGFLIFIHELGHYFMARRVGMTVEAFAIGFGKPVLSWECNGVKWHICALPFGGYVRIAGMEKKGKLEPHQIPDGFYGKKPIARIKVALMGPIVNIVFAFIAFVIIWIAGGREKPFSDYTRLIGWVDKGSDLYLDGVRPGDEIADFNGKPFEGFNELIYASLLDNKNATLKGFKIDYATGQRTPFDYTLEVDQDLRGIDSATKTVGILSPASYLIYDRMPDGSENSISAGSPMAQSGIEYKDRILWVDGQLIFSKKQLIATVNEPKTLLTVQRGAEVFLARVPRLQVSDLRIGPEQKAELDDWMHEAQLKTKLSDLFFIPYNLNPVLNVENALTYIDKESKEQKPCTTGYCGLDIPLQSGDKIIAVDGVAVNTSFEFLSNLQSRRIQVIVKHDDKEPVLSWKEADSHFDDGVNWNDLQKIYSSIGTPQPVKQLGNLRLLSSVSPKNLNDFPLSENQKERLANELSAQRKQIEKIEDPEQKAAALRLLEEGQKKVMLGIVLQDRLVTYNPSPFSMFFSVFKETYRTLVAVVTGVLSPKWLAGPVGIVQVMQYGWSLGVKEALFWLSMISLNLGIINLLPVPVLDGGHICFAIWESITKKPIKSKTMERLIIPFIVLIIAFFLYLTYHDLMRLVHRFFN